MRIWRTVVLPLHVINALPKSMILILRNFLSGVGWICQPDRTAGLKKAFCLRNEKAGSR
jgi:hypothetical protein